MTMKLIEGKAAIDKAIASIAGRGKKLDADIHKAACSILVHIDKYHEVTLANALIAALPAGSRKNALTAWFEAFAKARWNAETKVLDHVKDKVSMLEDGMASPWFDFKPEPPYKPLNLPTALAALVKKAEKAAVEGNGEDVVPAELLAALKTLAVQQTEG